MSTNFEWPRLALDSDLVAKLDWPRRQRHAEVVGGGVVKDADGDPGQHRDSMTDSRRRLILSDLKPAALAGDRESAHGQRRARGRERKRQVDQTNTSG